MKFGMNFESRASHSPKIPFSQAGTYTGTGNEHVAFPVLFMPGHTKRIALNINMFFPVPDFKM